MFFNFEHEKKILAFFIIGGALSWWIIRKTKAVMGLTWKIKNIRFNFYPDLIRIEGTIELTNSGAALNLEKITGTISINGKKAAVINQSLIMTIKPGVTNVPLNIATSVQNISSLVFIDWKNLKVNFTGSIKAEGLKIPLFFNYVP